MKINVSVDIDETRFLDHIQDTIISNFVYEHPNEVLIKWSDLNLSSDEEQHLMDLAQAAYIKEALIVVSDWKSLIDFSDLAWLLINKTVVQDRINKFREVAKSSELTE